jgi:hypothetical protein
MMPSVIRRRSNSVVLWALAATAFALASAAGVQAQVLSDPRVAEFDPSLDHWGVLDTGESAVLHYKLDVYLVGASTPLGTVDMGKPSPQTDGKIRYDFASQIASWSLPGGNYEARVSAVGPQGEALSDPSNPFTFSSTNACTFALSATFALAPAAGGSYSLEVVTGTGCTWTVTNALPWVTLHTGGGTGNGPVQFTVQSNSSTSSRNGTITIAGQTFTVSQDGVPACSYALSPGAASVAAGGGSTSFSVTTAAGCSWTASASDRWLTVAGSSGSGGGTVSVSAASNTSSAPRTATVSVQGQIFTVTQAGADPDCSYTVTPSVFSFSAAGGSGSATTTTGNQCGWTVVSSQSWLVPSVTNASGTGTFTFTARTNNGMTNRTGTLTVGPWAITVFQSGKPRRK